MKLKRGVIKRQEVKKKTTSKKVKDRRDSDKEKFLAKLQEMPIIQVAASQVDTHRSTYYRWYEEDPDFRERADQALASGVNLINDMMESMLIKLAKEGKVTPIIFWLKHNKPKYMEVRRYEHFHKHEFEENPLTEERKQQIYRAMKAWDDSGKDYQDERDEDYDGRENDNSKSSGLYDEDGNLIRK